MNLFTLFKAKIIHFFRFISLILCVLFFTFNLLSLSGCCLFGPSTAQKRQAYFEQASQRNFDFQQQVGNRVTPPQYFVCGDTIHPCPSATPLYQKHPARRPYHYKTHSRQYKFEKINPHEKEFKLELRPTSSISPGKVIKPMGTTQQLKGEKYEYTCNSNQYKK